MPLQAQGFKVSGLCKLQVSRFLAFSWPLEIQGFKVSSLFHAFAGSRFQGFWPLQIASFKVPDLFGASGNSRLQGSRVPQAPKFQGPSSKVPGSKPPSSKKQKKTKRKTKNTEVSVRWGGARLLYLNYDGVRGVPERGCSRGWQPPRMGQWRGECERGGVGPPSRSGRTAPILQNFNDQEAKSDLGLNHSDNRENCSNGSRV